MKLAAAMVVRDESTVLAANLSHHRALGVDEFWVVDNGSTDGTTDLLSEQARQFGDVKWRYDDGRYLQGEISTEMASAAAAAGADWILPIDADEFWWTRDLELRTMLADSRSVGGFICDVDNFVQRRSVHEERTDSLRTMTYRAVPRGTAEDARELVETKKIAFVEIVYPPKQVLRAAPGLVIGDGNHTVENARGPLETTSAIRVLHAPIRARSTLVRRAEFGKRVAAAYTSEETGWHLRRLTRLLDSGDLSDEWAASSQRLGRLRVGGRIHRLEKDRRLSDAVAPFL